MKVPNGPACWPTRLAACRYGMNGVLACACILSVGCHCDLQLVRLKFSHFERHLRTIATHPG
eukprot:6209109-Amphidinium_carterae.1